MIAFLVGVAVTWVIIKLISNQPGPDDVYIYDREPRE